MKKVSMSLPTSIGDIAGLISKGLDMASDGAKHVRDGNVQFKSPVVLKTEPAKEATKK